MKYTDEEMAERPELIRTMSVKPPMGRGRVRLVAIGDVDLQSPVAVGEWLNPHGVVEVAGGFAVDCNDIEVAKITAAVELSF